MAQVLHMEPGFPGQPTAPAPAPQPPYSVETPYGYRLDLDFLKYVEDIEKGNTVRRLPVLRRPRYSSLPHGTGSWWTSTESLCSTASVDSRRSAASCCYPLPDARVERTLLGARRRLEDQAGSTASLPALGGSRAGGTPLSSGLSTPVCPTPGHLQQVREQMATALRKLRQLEEQVKLIPVLQVKVAVLQEEKRQLSVQLKSQKFLSPPGRPRGELYIAAPEGEPEGGGRRAGERKEVRSVGVGTPGGGARRSVGVGVNEEQLVPEGQRQAGLALAAKVAVLEKQLQAALLELQAAREELAQAGPGQQPETPVKADALKVIRCEPEVAASTATGIAQQRQRAQSLQPPAGRRAPRQGEPGAPPQATRVETAFALPAAAPPAALVHGVKKISIAAEQPGPGGRASPEPLTATWKPVAPDSVPVQLAAPYPSPAEDPAAAQGGSGGAVKRPEGAPRLVGINSGYESTSSESSTAENSSDSESTASEYHEANEGLPAGQTETPKPPAPPRAPAEGDTAAAEQTPRAAQGRGAGVGLGPELHAACETVQKYLESPDTHMAEEKAAYGLVLQDWLQLSCHREAAREAVAGRLAAYGAISPRLLHCVVNMADRNGNTALHYTVSHSNFPLVQLLLETGLCTVDAPNKAGYTPIMLTALAATRGEADMATIRQLLQRGDVNAKASQAGQTALMLAVSHGRLDVVQALLACGADVNLQDADGSTALMCACEHGHAQIARLLLAAPACCVGLADHDGSTALSIALEAGHKDIAAMLCAHGNLATPPSLVRDTRCVWRTLTPLASTTPDQPKTEAAAASLPTETQ
ncbi:KN motif and ankyrin repeat domain-containing protein 2 isoform X2 [Carettochelys insculpta]|uniref:KN motif and ankyrin repeat domain-containing protein 2 isoform X2 n=1 Tax=Carettochelys insculpta TaxID=44489 RepID=UPI003EB9086C